jgi:hypothetical protein
MKSKRIIFIIIGMLFLSGLMQPAAEAQHPKVPPGGPFLPGQPPIQPKGSCRMDPSIIFTDEQAEKLTHLQRAYSGEVRPLLSELMDLRLDLRFAQKNPPDQPEALFDKQRKISALQAKLDDLFFSYQIKARAIFTKEQMDRFPSDCPLKMFRDFGRRRGFQRGPRR